MSLEHEVAEAAEKVRYYNMVFDVSYHLGNEDTAYNTMFPIIEWEAKLDALMYEHNLTEHDVKNIVQKVSENL